MSSPKIIFSAAMLFGASVILLSTQATAQNYAPANGTTSGTAYPLPAGPQNQPPPSTAIPGQYTSPYGNYSYNGDKPAAQAPSVQAYQANGADNSYLTQRYQAPVASAAPVIYPTATVQQAPVIYPVTPQTQTQNPSMVTSYTSGPIYKAADGSTYNQMPTYSYDPRLDPRQNPVPKAPQPPPRDEDESIKNHNHPYWDLATHTGIDVDAQLAYYRYKEPDFGVEESGAIFGLDVSGTYAYRTWFATVEARYGYVSADYSSSSGNASSQPTDTFEYRALVGKDIIEDTYSMSPYIGFGYRTLANDARGTTDLGAQGYRRYNQLWYIPIGVHPRTHIDSNSRLTSTLEYDYLIHGSQKTDLSDAGFGDPNFYNNQSSGYAIRGDIMYETRGGWSFGPYFTYWDISNSKIKNLLDHSATTCAPSSAPCVASFLEPANNTIEAGVKLGYHFF